MIYFEGFLAEGGDVVTYLERRGHTVHAGLETNTARLTGVSLEIENGESWVIPVTTGASYTIGFAVKCSSWIMTDRDLLYLRIGTDTHIELHLIAGEIAVVTSADTVITEGLRGKNDIWMYIEFKFVINNANGSYILRVNGKEWLNRTSIDTYNTGTISVDNFRFYADVATLLIDDLYISDDFLGDIQINRISPDGNGVVNDWTPFVGDNYEEIDDDPYDADTTYVETNTTTHQDLYTYSNLDVLGTIHAIQMNVVCRETDANDFNIEQLVRIDTTIYDETPVVIAGQTYETIVRVIDKDPSTALAWTENTINAAQFGFEATT